MVIRVANRPFNSSDVVSKLPRRLLIDLPGERKRRGILNILLRRVLHMM